MKKIVLLALLAITMAACTNSQPQTLTIDQVVENGEAMVNDTVTIQGLCTHICRHGGRKMFLMGSDNSKLLRIEAAQLGAFPTDCQKNQVKVKGVVAETRIDEQYLQNWEKQIAENNAEKHGESEGGCSTEKAARGETGNTTEKRIADFRQKIAQRQAQDGKDYLSFLYLTALEYEIINQE